uniref:Uncharacterized protein n=1 Tax=Arundo donax TaxID=35708 RepID=A0A0A9ADR9_ARUDO
MRMPIYRGKMEGSGSAAPPKFAAGDGTRHSCTHAAG